MVNMKRTLINLFEESVKKFSNNPLVWEKIKTKMKALLMLKQKNELQNCGWINVFRFTKRGKSLINYQKD